MTHLESIIRDVKRFVPTSTSQKKLKRRVLIKLYGIENKEPMTKRRKRQSKKSGGISDIINSSIAEGVKQYKAHKESQHQKRIQKANTVKALMHSNLSEQRKKEQIEQVRHKRGLAGLFSGHKGRPNYVEPEIKPKTDVLYSHDKSKIIRKKYDDSGNVIEVSTLDE